MIKKIHIQHFKGLSDIMISDLARVTLLGGRNNVGKTSVLEALFLFFDRHNPDAILRQFGWRNMPFVPLQLESLWAPLFTQYEMDQPIEIKVNNEQGECSTLSLRLNTHYTRHLKMGVPGLHGMPAKIDTQTQSSPSLALDLIYQQEGFAPHVARHILEPKGMSFEIENAPINTVQKAAFLTATTRIPPQEDAIRFTQLDLIGKQQYVVDFLRETVEPRLQGLSANAVGDQFLIHAQLSDSNRKIPVAFLGDGLGRLLSIILVIMTTENGYVLIDEVENGIHYSAFPSVWSGIVKVAKQFNCQVLATTHSHECLQAAFQGLDDATKEEFAYVRLERVGSNIEGKTYSADLVIARGPNVIFNTSRSPV